jgi:Chlorophyll A-B binding protein
MMSWYDTALQDYLVVSFMNFLCRPLLFVCFGWAIQAIQFDPSSSHSGRISRRRCRIRSSRYVKLTETSLFAPWYASRVVTHDVCDISDMCDMCDICDIKGVAKSREMLFTLREAEVKHARLAMLAVRTATALCYIHLYSIFSVTLSHPTRTAWIGDWLASVGAHPLRTS